MTDIYFYRDDDLKITYRPMDIAGDVRFKGRSAELTNIAEAIPGRVDEGHAEAKVRRG
jgi:hypothetical protein